MYEKGMLYTMPDPKWDDNPDDMSERQLIAKLPHSCDGWVIGGVKEITALIADLQGARREIREAMK